MNREELEKRVELLKEHAKKLAGFLDQYYNGQQMTHGQWEDCLKLMDLQTKIVDLEIKLMDQK